MKGGKKEASPSIKSRTNNPSLAPAASNLPKSPAPGTSSLNSPDPDGSSSRWQQLKQLASQQILLDPVVVAAQDAAAAELSVLNRNLMNLTNQRHATIESKLASALRRGNTVNRSPARPSVSPSLFHPGTGNPSSTVDFDYRGAYAQEPLRSTSPGFSLSPNFKPISGAAFASSHSGEETNRLAEIAEQSAVDLLARLRRTVDAVADSYAPLELPPRRSAWGEDLDSHPGEYIYSQADGESNPDSPFDYSYATLHPAFDTSTTTSAGRGASRAVKAIGSTEGGKALHPGGHPGHLTGFGAEDRRVPGGAVGLKGSKLVPSRPRVGSASDAGHGNEHRPENRRVSFADGGAAATLEEEANALLRRLAEVNVDDEMFTPSGHLASPSSARFASSNAPSRIAWAASDGSSANSLDGATAGNEQENGTNSRNSNSSSNSNSRHNPQLHPGCNSALSTALQTQFRPVSMDESKSSPSGPSSDTRNGEYLEELSLPFLLAVEQAYSPGSTSDYARSRAGQGGPRSLLDLKPDERDSEVQGGLDLLLKDPEAFFASFHSVQRQGRQAIPGPLSGRLDSVLSQCDSAAIPVSELDPSSDAVLSSEARSLVSVALNTQRELDLSRLVSTAREAMRRQQQAEEAAQRHREAEEVERRQKLLKEERDRAELALESLEASRMARLLVLRLWRRRTNVMGWAREGAVRHAQTQRVRRLLLAWRAVVIDGTPTSEDLFKEQRKEKVAAGYRNLRVLNGCMRHWRLEAREARREREAAQRVIEAEKQRDVLMISTADKFRKLWVLHGSLHAWRQAAAAQALRRRVLQGETQRQAKVDGFLHRIQDLYQQSPPRPGEGCTEGVRSNTPCTRATYEQAASSPPHANEGNARNESTRSSSFPQVLKDSGAPESGPNLDLNDKNYASGARVVRCQRDRSPARVTFQLLPNGTVASSSSQSGEDVSLLSMTGLEDEPASKGRGGVEKEVKVRDADIKRRAYEQEIAGQSVAATGVAPYALSPEAEKLLDELEFAAAAQAEDVKEDLQNGGGDRKSPGPSCVAVIIPPELQHLPRKIAAAAAIANSLLDANQAGASERVIPRPSTTATASALSTRPHTPSSIVVPAAAGAPLLKLAAASLARTGNLDPHSVAMMLQVRKAGLGRASSHQRNNNNNNNNASSAAAALSVLATSTLYASSVGDKEGAVAEASRVGAPHRRRPSLSAKDGRRQGGREDAATEKRLAAPNAPDPTQARPFQLATDARACQRRLQSLVSAVSTAALVAESALSASHWGAMPAPRLSPEKAAASDGGRRTDEFDLAHQTFTFPVASGVAGKFTRSPTEVDADSSHVSPRYQTPSVAGFGPTASLSKPEAPSTAASTRSQELRSFSVDYSKASSVNPVRSDLGRGSLNEAERGFSSHVCPSSSSSVISQAQQASKAASTALSSGKQQTWKAAPSSSVRSGAGPDARHVSADLNPGGHSRAVAASATAAGRGARTAEKTGELSRLRLVQQRRWREVTETAKRKATELETAQEKLAAAHYCRTLLLRLGLHPWRRLMAESAEHLERADLRRRRRCLEIALRALRREAQGGRWRHVGREAAALAAAGLRERERVLRANLRAWLEMGRAALIHQRRLKLWALRTLRLALRLACRHEVVASDHNRRRRLGGCFVQWHWTAQKEASLTLAQELQLLHVARQELGTRLASRAFREWRLLAVESKDQRGAMRNKDSMRQKIDGWLQEIRQSRKTQGQGVLSKVGSLQEQRTADDVQ